MAHKWGEWLHRPRRVGGAQHLGARDKMRSGPQVGRLATSPLPCGRPPTLQSGVQRHKWPRHGHIGYVIHVIWGSLTPRSGGQSQKCPTSGQIAYVTPGIWGVDNTCERWIKQDLPQKWGDWRPDRRLVGSPQRFRARANIRTCREVGGLPTSPMPPWGSQLQSEEQKQKWPRRG